MLGDEGLFSASTTAFLSAPLTPSMDFHPSTGHLLGEAAGTRITQESSVIREPRHTMASCVWACTTLQRAPQGGGSCPLRLSTPHANTSLGQNRGSEGRRAKNAGFEVPLIWGSTALPHTS